MGAKSWSSVNNSDDDNQQSGQAQDQATVVNAQGNVTVTDSGAVLGNVAIANTALETAARISAQTQDSLMAAIDGVQQASKNTASVSSNFANAFASVKKTELAGSGAVWAEALKYWPILPIAFALVAGVRRLN